MREAAGRNRHFATGQKIQPNLFVSCKTVSGMPSLKSNVLMKDLLTPCTKCSNRGQNALEAGCLKILVPSYGWRFRLPPFSPIFRCLCGEVRQNPRESRRPRDGVLKALELDDTLAEAHASLANIKFSNDWDWQGAEKEFQRAIALNPNDSSSHLY
jgi:hypothetical protein